MQDEPLVSKEEIERAFAAGIELKRLADEWANPNAIKAIPGQDTVRRIYRRIAEGASRLFRPSPRDKDDNIKEQKERQATALRKVNSYRVKFKAETDKLGKQLAENKIKPRVFRAAMLTEIRYLIVTGAAAGAGGFGYLNQDDIARIDEEMKRQAVFLDRWIAQLERQPPEQRSAAYISNRAQMYAGSAWTTAQETIDKSMHREFPDLPFYPKDWTTECKPGCECTWEWHVHDAERGDADVYWRLGIAEHCPTCKKRFRALSPLKIRDGKFVDAPDFRTLMI